MADQLQTLIGNLKGLGPARLAALAAVLVTVVALVAGGSWFMSRPTFETLYVGLDRDDVNRMGIVLSEAGISYDIDSKGGTFLVEAGETSRARMILAEKGLPGSAGAGYELFDNLGTLGLTSFMQEVTRVRALEGEIARTIQSVSGIKAARVHLVIPDQGGFRDRDRKPTASVLIRTNGSDVSSKAMGIRHLVAAAVPGLSRSDVTVLDASGKLLAAGEDTFGDAISVSLDLEKNVENELAQKISDALRPHIGNQNFRVSVNAELDTDRKRVEETIYDPDSRVERSVQVVKTQDSSSQAESVQNTTVEQNIPTDQNNGANNSAQKTQENSERREETTNYEINTKRVAVTSNGFEIKRLSVAVVVNRDMLAKTLPAGTDIDARLAKLRDMVSVAAGLKDDRGDKLNVTAIEFLPEDQEMAPVDAGMGSEMQSYVNTAIKAGAFLAVAALVVFFGLRPLTRAAFSNPDAAAEGADAFNADFSSELEATTFGEGGLGGDFAPGMGQGLGQGIGGLPDLQAANEDGDYLQVLRNQGMTPKERLEIMVDYDEERTIQVLRRWLNEAA
ncbi:flagellar M-ring protein FliF [Zhengella mangrovi]|uniref:Flagellar M-ring protein n=1 Tax=Zhengella mangrovi TaxID=1982044 RepID=A0A2G1QJM0_9HYPH|nr:flagellar basal-body MS-ring/collar protein FliF [Zhengella mangrovi]PHP65723.1 flagellar M-ring protein FliF [Zhengella mangrovi]